MYSRAIYIKQFSKYLDWDGERKYAEGVLDIDSSNENGWYGHGSTESKA